MAERPEYRYLGPGNELQNGIPVNETDRIARLHDIAYNYAESKCDIFKADETAIKRFAQIFARDLKNYKLNYAAAAGVGGLSIKTIVERILHTTLYPWNPDIINKTDFLSDRIAKAALLSEVKDNLWGGILKDHNADRGQYPHEWFWDGETARKLEADVWLYLDKNIASLNPIRSDPIDSCDWIEGKLNFRGIVEKVSADWLAKAKTEYFTENVLSDDYRREKYEATQAKYRFLRDPDHFEYSERKNSSV